MKRAGQVALPEITQPMLATLSEKPFDNKDWLFELKLDGMRAIVVKNGQKLEMWTRNGKSLSHRFPDAGRGCRSPARRERHSGWRDRRARRQRAGALQSDSASHSPVTGEGHRGRRSANPRLLLCLRLALSERLQPDEIPLDRTQSGSAEAARQCSRDGSALPITSKRRASASSMSSKSTGSRGWLPNSKPANTSRRVPDIGSKSKPSTPIILSSAVLRRRKGHANTSDRCLSGLYNNGDLIYVGRSGGGFDDQTLAETMKELKPLETKTCPFKEVPAEVRRSTWVQPQLVCEIRFAEWTSDQETARADLSGLSRRHRPEAVPVAG